MHALNSSCSYQYYGDIDEVMQVDVKSPSTMAAIELFHKAQRGHESIFVDLPAAFVLRPVK